MVALEHTLIMLLLLISLLRARPNMPRVAQWAAMSVILLAFIAPTLPVNLPWGLFSTLVIPLLLWHTAQRLGNSRWQSDIRDLAVWLVLVIGITAAVSLTGNLPLASALLFGLLVASIAWHAASESDGAKNGESNDSLLGQIGMLTLVFLLTEIDTAIEAPGAYLLTLVSGAALGAVVGAVAVRAAARVPVGLPRDLLSLAQAYLAYGLGVLLGVSGITAAAMSIIIYVAYGARSKLWPEGVIGPKPFSSVPLYILAVLALAFFGWQIHIPLTPTLALELGLGLLITAFAVWLGHRIQSPTLAPPTRLAPILVRVMLLLLPALLLWPRGLLLDPIPLAAALGVASLTALGAHLSLAPLLNLYHWLSQLSLEPGPDAASAEPVPLVRDLMRRDPIRLAPGVPVYEIARLFGERETNCVLIENPPGELAGIITEADLFVKEVKLPRTEQTYPSLFNVPVAPERLPEIYAREKFRYTAADIMTSPAVTVKDTDTAGSAIRLMVSYGFKCLPVLQDQPDGSARVVGIIARSDIIRLLSGVPLQEEGVSVSVD